MRDNRDERDERINFIVDIHKKFLMKNSIRRSIDMNLLTFCTFIYQNINTNNFININ